MDAPALEPEMQVEENTTVTFPALKPSETNGGALQTMSVKIPKHRMNPLKEAWMSIYKPIVEYMKLQTSEYTEEIGALQKSADFVKAFVIGFTVEDATALLRLEDLYVESFTIDDGDHLARAVGRIAGKDGKTKFTIENSTKTRIVLADKKIHIMGTYANIRVARDAICDLILGSPPGKVYGKLRGQSARLNERF